MVFLGALSAAGVTNQIDLRNAVGGVTFQVTVSSIGTNVVLRFEGSVDDVDYFAMEADRTVTSDGTIGFWLGAQVPYARCRLVSFTGGSPLVTVEAATR